MRLIDGSYKLTAPIKVHDERRRQTESGGQEEEICGRERKREREREKEKERAGRKRKTHTLHRRIYTNKGTERWGNVVLSFFPPALTF